jgi:flavin-binding protein dodecin
MTCARESISSKVVTLSLRHSARRGNRSRPARSRLQQGERRMSDNVYKIIEIVGSSETSIEDAIEGAIAARSTSVRRHRWFEVKETPAMSKIGRVAHFQVTLRVGLHAGG